MNKRMWMAALLLFLLVLIVAGQHVWASITRRAPWTTELQLAALPVLPWTQMPAPPSIALQLPFGFHDRGPDAIHDGVGVTHRAFGFGDYRTQHPLGGGTTHMPIQVDIVVAAADAADGALAGRFYNSAAFVAVGAAAPDDTEAISDPRVTVAHYDRTASGEPLRAIVVVDAAQRLRVEVIDQLNHFDRSALQAFALQVFENVR